MPLQLKYSLVEAGMKSAQTYYPFGMMEVGRLCSPELYRYGYQNQEFDSELKDIGNSINYKYRVHDPRLGRFMRIDPLTTQYPWYTPYQFAGNTPIQAIDIDGAEPGYVGKNGELAYAGNTTPRDDGTTDPTNYLWEWADNGWKNLGATSFYFNFSAGEVQKQINARMNEPSKIDQGYSSTCGMASCAMAFAKKHPKEYGKFLMELASSGSASYKKYSIHLTSRIIKVNTNYYKDSGMPESDWILLATMRNYSNSIFSYGGSMCNLYEKFSAINWPSEVRNTIEDLGFKVEYYAMDPFHKMAFENELSYIQAIQNRGGTTIILLNDAMFENSNSYISNHYVVYGGGLIIDEKQKTVQFKVWTWGYCKDINCTLEKFENNYSGRISFF